MNGLNKGFLRKVIKMMCQTPVYDCDENFIQCVVKPLALAMGI